MNTTQNEHKLARPDLRGTRPLDFVSSISRCRLGLTSRVMQTLYLHALLSGREGLARELRSFLKELLEDQGSLNASASEEESEACSSCYHMITKHEDYGHAVKQLLRHEPILHLGDSLDEDRD